MQNLLGTDCAKARVNLCVNKDPNCLPFQNIIDVNGSSSAAAVGQVAPVLEQNCPIVDPSIPGVKVCVTGRCWQKRKHICHWLQGQPTAVGHVTAWKGLYCCCTGSLGAVDVSNQARHRMCWLQLASD